jgi:NAD(P)-dependent dehydrogenase (short-subunit alcohol dehydrogenase family)
MGAKVIITARNEKRLNETFLQMDNQNDHKIISADLSDEDSIEKIVEFVPDRLDGIVQCAGFTVSKPFQFLSKENIKSVMTVNFEAPVLLTQQLLKKKKIAKPASVVFISSISGVLCSSPAGSIYSASKGAVNGIVKNLAIELSVKGIRVNCVNPGMIDTNIFESGVISEEQLREDMKKYPLKRYGRPEEVAYAAIYLLSDASSWVTGSNLVIDGGYTLN